MDLLQTMTQALTAAYNSAPPDTTAQARQLTRSLPEQLAELAEWAEQIADLIGDIEAAAGELDDAGRDDRPDAHTSWVEAVDALRSHLAPAGQPA